MEYFVTLGTYSSTDVGAKASMCLAFVKTPSAVNKTPFLPAKPDRAPSYQHYEPFVRLKVAA